MDLDVVYEQLDEKGLQYGPAFQGLRGAWRSGEAMWARIELPVSVLDGSEYGMHPALLDASLHGVALLTTLESSDESLYLPFALERFSLWQTGALSAWVQIDAVQEEAQSVRTSFTLYGDNGEALGQGVGVQLKKADTRALRRAQANRVKSLQFSVDWQPIALTGDASGIWALWDNDSADSLEKMLGFAGVSTQRVQSIDEAQNLEAAGLVCLWPEGEGGLDERREGGEAFSSKL